MNEADEQGWHTVSGRRRKFNNNNLDNFDKATTRNFRKNSVIPTTTFFFTNLPDRYGAKVLFNAFNNHGDIMEVFIPAKRDRGRRFGFARFARV
jgi:hypothetical protein